MPPKETNKVAVTNDNKKKLREEVETPQSAPPKQLQKKVPFKGDGTQPPAVNADGVGGSSVESRVRVPSRVQEQGVLGGEVINSQTAPESGGSLGATSFDEIISLIKGLSISQQNHQAEMTLLAKENSERISALEKELVALEPAVADRFKVVEEKVLDDERASVASFQEIQEIETQLRNGAMVLEAKQNEQQEFNQQQATLNQQQELRNQQQDKYNADVSDAMKELLAEVKNMREENLRLKEKTERLERELALQQLRSSQLEKQRERVVNSLGLQVNTSTWPVSDNPTENIPQVQAPFNNRQGSRYIRTPNTVKSPEDVEMTDATPPDYDQVVPEFDGKNMEQMVIFIEDHLTGDAERWYKMDEMYEQKDSPDPLKLLERIEEEFYSERDIEDVKNQMLKLRHNWGQAYEYLSEFNKYSRILNLSEETKKLVLSWQVKPSIREAFYDLPREERTLEGYIKCLKKCDAFPSTYRIEQLEKNDAPANRNLSLMGLLGIMDPMRPSKVAELRRKRKEGYFRKEVTKEKPKDSYNDKSKDTSYVKKEEKKYLDGDKNRKDNNSYSGSRRNSAWKDSRSSSNNPLPKSYAVKEISSMEYAPLARFEKLDGKKCDEPVQTWLRK
ncbi:hypothetical protein PIROE2DRAFT_19228 [Piromyces sp. E2]|nr:hypothetical protein PIROE2DRAFT_19228 [Piromyces sp. E2]|eukprot:OUM56243.1 hypothetical protein PIROE2DRAFT_19228 [Piromyces sp. E2]